MAPPRGPNPLARFINIPGGMTVEQAQERAETRLETMRNRSMADVDENVTCIGAYLALIKTGEPPRVVREELQRLATCIVSLAGTFGREGMGKAAYSLCRLIDLGEERRFWDRVAIDVHYDALRALRNPHSAESEAHVLDGLRRVIHRVKGLH